MHILKQRCKERRRNQIDALSRTLDCLIQSLDDKR